MGDIGNLHRLSDTELQEEIDRREKIRRKEQEEAFLRRYREALEREKARDREFAASIGITYEQLQQVEEYVGIKQFEE